MNCRGHAKILGAVVMAGLLAALAAASTPLASRYNTFGFDLFTRLARSQAGNVVISPTSIALALSMAQNGAGGKTRAAIARVLHSSDLSDAQLNSDAAALMRDVPASNGDVQFAIANSLWVRNGFEIRSSFERTMQDSYQAEIANIPFNDAGLAQLNGWVKDHTFALIPKILDRFDALDRAVLVNALALKAKWLHPFDPHATSPAPFYSGSGASRSISMMRQGAQFEYAKGKDWQLVRLPYRGNRFAMYIFLPAKGAHIAMSSSAFEHARSQLKEAELQLQIPRFTVNYSANLNQPLSQLGMAIAFQPSAADFSRMSASPLFISRVVHVTYVRVDEEGTQAAAATAIVMTTKAILVRREQMIVDHPFYMALRDDQSNQILFLSHIEAPG